MKSLMWLFSSIQRHTPASFRSSIMPSSRSPNNGMHAKITTEKASATIVLAMTMFNNAAKHHAILQVLRKKLGTQGRATVSQFLSEFG
jgi:hypothetical protein